MDGRRFEHRTFVTTMPWASALFAALASCGGASVSESESGGDGGGASGSSASGGTASGGTTAGGSGGAAAESGGAGTGATPGVDDCSNALPSEWPGPCVQNCTDRPEQATSPECFGTRYVCAGETQRISDCPDDSCARRDTWQCCRSESGVVDPMRCSADGGGTLPCTVGSARQERGAMCAPDGADTAHCSLLEGRPCENGDQQCHEGTGCSESGCYCTFDASTGAYAWSCWVVACRAESPLRR